MSFFSKLYNVIVNRPRSIIYAMIGFLLSKNTSFIRFALKKWNYFVRSAFEKEIADSFVAHKASNTYQQDYEGLIAGLDQFSIELINDILPRYKIVSDNNIIHNDIVLAQEKYKKMYDEWMIYYKNHNSLHHTWYKVLNDNRVLDYCKDKLILDCWAFDWKETEFFDRYIPNHWWVVAFEPVELNYNKLCKRFQKYNAQWEVYKVNKWLWSSAWFINMMWGDEGETVRIAWQRTDQKENDAMIEITTIGHYVIANHWSKKVWLIKRDVEWYEEESLLWAKAVIEKDRPVLVISIYHHAQQFFGIKPLIESWNLWYTFEVYQSEPINIFAWVVLLAYPKEVNDIKNT